MEEASAGEFKAAPRVHHHFAGGLLARNLLDRFDGHRHGERGANFSFINVQRHFVCVLAILVLCAESLVFGSALLWLCGSPFAFNVPWLANATHHRLN